MAAPLRLRLAKAILGSKAKDYIPALNPSGDGIIWPGSGGPGLLAYDNKADQLSANVNWCYTANNAITEPAAAIQLKAYRRNAKGEKVEVRDDNAQALMDLIDNPNNFHTGEQLMDLHYGYRNFTGEAYTMMIRNGNQWVPKRGQLPDALQEVPAHEVQFSISDRGYSYSTVRWSGDVFEIGMFIRDIKPDMRRPYYGQSVISAAASIINSDSQMRDWNNNLMNNGAKPSLIFSTNEQLEQEVYERWKSQFADEHTGALNAGKPMLIEAGDAKPFMLSPQDLDFLDSRKFTRDEILAMWRVNPYIIGAVEDVNLATAKAARIQHAEINIEPRVRQWVRQLNATMVKVFDSGLELGYEEIVPEDDEAKLKYHTAAANKWETIDEARAAYGQKPVKDKLGDTIYLPSSNAPLASIADGTARPAPVAPGSNPAQDDPNADGTDDPNKDGQSKALDGVKKKT